MFRFTPRIAKKRTNVCKRMLVSIDNFDSQDFNTNEAGWIRNTISELSRCTSRSQYEAQMSRLVQLAQKGDVNPDMTIEQQFSMIKPRYAQSYNEIQQYIEMTNNVVHGRISQAYEKALKEKQQEIVKAPEQPKSPVVADE